MRAAFPFQISFLLCLVNPLFAWQVISLWWGPRMTNKDPVAARVGDVVAFKWSLPYGTRSLILLPNLRAYRACAVNSTKKRTLVAPTRAGAFEFPIQSPKKNYYFASGVGSDCTRKQGHVRLWIRSR